MRVSVIVPAYNCARALPRALAAIARQDLAEPFELIVVDDGSTDGTGEVARAAEGPVTVVRKDHAGPGRARNLGAEVASGDTLAFTDADCEPDRDWLSAGLRALESADLVQGAVLPERGVPAGPFDRFVAVGGQSGLFETANLFVRRELFDRLGGFKDVIAKRSFGEDALFGWRARRTGARIAFAPDAVVQHAVTRPGAPAYIAERRRLAYFPELAAQIPELRDEWFFARYFLTRRSAAFDLALAGVASALAARTLVPAALALPYAAAVARKARIWRSRAPLVAVVDVAADAVGFAALARGSARSRRPVL